MNGSGFVPMSPSVIVDPTMLTGSSPSLVSRKALRAVFQALIDAQGWCAVSTEERLGSMGTPIKLEIKGQPVFLCCKGCQKTAEADPDKTLAKVEELKAKVKAEKAAKGGS